MTMQVAQVAEAMIIRGRNALVNVAGELLTESTPDTPYRKGELRAKRRVSPTGKGAKIRWTARHAGAQEAGQARGRVFQNYTTAGTGKGFVEKNFSEEKVKAKLAEELIK